MRSRFVFCFVLFLLVFSGIGSGLDCGVYGEVRADQEGPDREAAEIDALIRQLGDDQYVVRQRAEAHLLRLGIKAFSRLKEALKHDDVEIARRAEHILRQFELIYQSYDNEAVRLIVNEYSIASDDVQKAKYIQLLASPDSFYGNPGGEGLQTLCRIVRFEQERPLRAEAVKALIASPPHTPSKRSKWYRSLVQQFADPGDDELLRLIYDFAKLRCDVDTLKESTEKQIRENAAVRGMFVDYPVSLLPDDAMLRQLEILTKRIAAFQADPDNNQLVPGSWLDILMFYALAEIQDDLGRSEQRDRSRLAARAVRAKELPPENQLVPIDPLDGRPFNDHFYVARFLQERHRFHWSLDHCAMALEEGEISIRRDACTMTAHAWQMIGDMTKTAEAFDRKIEILQSDDYSRKYGDSKDRIKDAEARKLYCLAQPASEAGDWKKTVELIDRILQRDPDEIDTIILRHQASRHLPELGQAYRDRTKTLINEAVARAEKQLNAGLAAPFVCNQVAWLLANTDGDYATTTALINITIQAEPESPAYLDTQAHVFALGKDYDQAVNAQEEAVRLAPEAGVFRNALQRFRTLAAETKRSSGDR